MTTSRFFLPNHRLPRGFPGPAPPARPREAGAPTIASARPAATVILLRPGRRGGLEVLLLGRVRTSGFVPGAFVFPGGGVDPADGGPELGVRTRGVTEEEASRRLGLEADATTSALAFYVAAVREALEETGIPVGLVGAEGPVGPEAARPARASLLTGGGTLGTWLSKEGWWMDAAALEYVAHWVTPEVEARRFDTRFFAAAVPPGVDAEAHEPEISQTLWITPEEALDRNRAGELPMVFPTILTLERLTGFPGPGEALASFRDQTVPRILPRLERTPDGVALEFPAGDPPGYILR